MSEVLVRKAQAADVETILVHRQQMFKEMGFSTSQVNIALQRSRHDFYRGILGNTFHAWLAMLEDKVIAVSGVVIHEWPSHPANLEMQRRAYVVNVFTQPEHRRQGVAHLLMKEIIGWARRQRFPALFLHPSEQAKKLYEDLGFTPTSEMKLSLDRAAVAE